VAWTQTPDSVVVKYYLTDLTRAALLRSAVPRDQVRGRAHFRAEYSPQGELLRVEFVPAEAATAAPAAPTRVGAPPGETTGPTRAPFIPLTPEQQAALNAENSVIREAAYWARWKHGRSAAPDTADDAVATIPRIPGSPEEQDREGRGEGGVPAESGEQRPQEVIAVMQMEAPEPVQESMVVKGTLRQRIVTAEPGGVRYFKHWNVRTGELSGPLARQKAEGRHYRAYFDDRGILSRVTYYNRRGRRQWSYRLHRDSTGIYQRYDVEYHVRQPLTRLDSYLFAPDLSEMRPGWRAEFILDPKRNRPQEVRIYDAHDIFYYSYTFSYQRDPDTTRTGSVLESRYYRADSSLVGSHRLYFGPGEELQRIEYYKPTGELKLTKEFLFDRERNELMVTLRDPQGEILDRRIIPK
jgi:hypothetical protein